MKYPTIRFQGVDYILVAGAITKKEDFEAGRVSYAHLCPDGQVWRFGRVIGAKDDIEFTGETETHADEDAHLKAAINFGQAMKERITGTGEASL